jgi:hypothetical protein
MIRIRLSNKSSERIFQHKSTKDSNQRRLTFKRSWIVGGSLQIGESGNKFLKDGIVNIKEGTPPEDEFATFAYIPSFTYSDTPSYIPSNEADEKIIPDCFEASVYIPTDTFNYLLNLNDGKSVICLSMDFGFSHKKIKSVPFGDTGELFWDLPEKVSGCPWEIPESIEIYVTCEAETS